MEDIEQIMKEEGDHFEWIYTAKNGLEVDCFIERNRLLALCGYVVITSDNELFGLDYDNIYSQIDVSVHGGLNYSDENNGEWIIGFDCAHSGDLCPSFLQYGRFGSKSVGISDGDIYRTKEFVISECEKLAESISEFSGVVKRLKKIDSVIGDN
jgi:hypothetical protein